MDWFLKHKPHLAAYVMEVENLDPAFAGGKLIALVPKDRLGQILKSLLDETEFLSPHGIRSLSRKHADEPYRVTLAGHDLEVGYVPAEGTSRMFGGNSNWRGPVWFPMNVLTVHSLDLCHAAYGDALQVEFPTGSGNRKNLLQVSQEIAARLSRLFLRDEVGRRTCHGEERRFIDDPNWRDLLLFNEYFSGDTGRGVGASHQTGWTATVTVMLERLQEWKKQGVRTSN
jgi:hypothetical protein